MSKDNLSLSLKIRPWTARMFLPRGSVVLACLGARHETLTVTVCDELDSFTVEFPFVVQRGLPTDIVFGSNWCVYRRDVGVHVPLPSSELTVGDGA